MATGIELALGLRDAVVAPTQRHQNVEQRYFDAQARNLRMIEHTCIPLLLTL